MSLSFVRAILITDPVIIFGTIFFGTLSLVASLFDARGRLQHRVARLWAKVIVKAAGVRVHAEGVETLDRQGVYILIANHASYMDIPVLLATLPLEIRFMAKRSLFRVPFMGWHLHRAGHIPVFLDEPRAALRTLSDAARIIREAQVSVIWFPEGGRELKGLGEFKEGPAYMALKAGVTVVPIGLAGMRHVLPMDRFLDIRGGTVYLRVGDPIPVEGWTLKDRGRLTALFRERVARLLPGEDGGVINPANVGRL